MSVANLPTTITREELNACYAILKQGSKNFAAASRLLPRRVRDPAAIVYAFCRTADDTIDRKQEADWDLQNLNQRLKSIYSGQPQNELIDRAFAAVIMEYQIPRALPEALLEGFRWDLERRQYETIDDLYEYAVRVASTVGLMMTLLMGQRDHFILARACDLGVAMQLTNIARDVGEDARMGRLYLPLTWMRDAGINPTIWLKQPRFNAELGTVIARLLQKADELYLKAESGIPGLPSDCQAAIWVARFMYAEINTVIRRIHMDSISQRASTTEWCKFRLWARAIKCRLLNHKSRLFLQNDPLPEAISLIQTID